MLVMGKRMIMRNRGGCHAVSYANEGAGLTLEKYRIVSGWRGNANEEPSLVTSC